MRWFRIAAALLALGAAGQSAEPKTTFTRDVAPILYRRCVECHRAGEVAPMPLLTYRDARPWAKAIREKVLERSMPPWLADSRYGHFANDRRLSQQEIDTIVAWVDGGAPQGEERDLPPAPHFREGWNVGEPDVVFSLPEEYAVPASGVISYQHFLVPTGFTRDTWVQAAEIRPGNRSVVHHVIVYVREADGSPLPAGPVRVREGRDLLLVGFAPGEQPSRMPPGTAKLIKAGSSLIFQVHYTPNGKPATDRSKVGLVLAKGPVRQKALTGRALNFGFAIPAGDSHHEVTSTWTFKEDVSLSSMMPHMHLRGKDFLYTVTYPDGRRETLLSVPRYDFNWQLSYALEKPLFLPKGSRLDCVAHFDNSVNNRFNPDPTKEVRWGPQTWDEMMIGWFNYTVPVETGGTQAN